MSRFVLGTAQFGFNYGISNKRGKIPKKEVFQILDCALRYGIDTLDTAYNYGESERVIGEYMQKRNNLLNIISKLPSTKLRNVERYLLSSLRRSGLKKIYAYLFHDFDTFKKNPKILHVLQAYQKKGLIKKIGFSLYYPKELEHLLDKKIKFDIVQVPYNIFDQRFASYFPKLKSKRVEIHVRSVFLQGLLFKKPVTLTDKFIRIKPKLRLLNDLSKKLNVPLAALCLNFALNNNYIDKIVIGVDCKRNLEENIQCIKYKKLGYKIYKQLLLLRENNEDIILPFNWNK